jgi:hypothetical protein
LRFGGPSIILATRSSCTGKSPTPTSTALAWRKRPRQQVLPQDLLLAHSDFASPRQDSSKYIELIRQIPTNHFSEFGLREGMIDKYYGAKKGGASGFYTKVLDVKKKVQAVTRLIDGIGTPLSKIPSGRGLNDVKDQFILNDYKAVMGAVSIVSSSFLWLHNVDFNCTFFRIRIL